MTNILHGSDQHTYKVRIFTQSAFLIKLAITDHLGKFQESIHTVIPKLPCYE